MFFIPIIRSITCFSYILMISLEQMADYLNIMHFVLTISLDLMKSSEVRKAGDESIYVKIFVWPPNSKLQIYLPYLLN